VYNWDTKVRGLQDGSSSINFVAHDLTTFVDLVLPLNSGESAGWLVGLLLMLVGIDTILVIWFLKLYVEGRTGATPGKWLMSLRTVRTTLRPCGFARCLLRDLFLWVDLLGCLTPIPALISLSRSSICQRWGDRVADTIVVRAGEERMKVEGR
jgi:uncharacterized RDD family membrane protein YckC